MSPIDSTMPTEQLLRLAADHHKKQTELSEREKGELIALLKARGEEELDYGQELVIDSVRLIKRVTGAVGIYFS